MSALKVWARQPGPGSIVDVLGKLALLPPGRAGDGNHGSQAHPAGQPFTPQYAMVALPGHLIFTQWADFGLTTDQLEQSLWGRLFNAECELRWANDLGTHYWVMLAELSAGAGKILEPGDGWEPVPGTEGLKREEVTHACFGTSLENGRGWTEQRIWPLIISYPYDVADCPPHTRLGMDFVEYRCEGRPVFVRLAGLKEFEPTKGGQS